MIGARVAALGTVGAILGVATVVAIGGLIFGPSTAGPHNASGADVLTITSGDARSLTNADVDAIVRGVPDIAALSRAVLGTAPVGAAGGLSDAGPTAVQGVDPSFAQVTRDTVAQGTFFTSQDAASANRVAVLGQALSSQLFQNGQPPVGATIRIRNVPFTVIGVLAGQTNNSDNAVLIPFQTGQVRLFGTNALNSVLVQVADPSQADAVSQDVEQLLRQRHQIRSGQPDGFTIRTNLQPPGDAGAGTASPLARQFLDRVRQYSCEAKGLCPRAQLAQQ